MLGFASLDIGRSDYVDSNVPLPAPGYDVRLHVNAPADEDYRLNVAVPANQLEREKVLSSEAPPLLCDMTVTTFENGKRVNHVSAKLLSTGTYEWGHTILYGSPPFRMPSGQSIVEIRNEGCANGAVFKGGLASIDQIKRYRFNLGLNFALLSYGLGIFGLVTLALAVIAKRK
jgi:hypothetical protein